MEVILQKRVTNHSRFVGNSTRVSRLRWPPTMGKEISAAIEFFKLVG